MQASVPPGVEVDTWRLDPDDFEDLLAAAERALLLEDVLSAAQQFVSVTICADGHTTHPRCRRCGLRAAIDRAEGKP